MTQNHDINDALKGNFMLIDHTISRWSASKPDRRLAAEAAAAHNASPEAVRVTKKLMAGADGELKAVDKALNAVRTYIYTVSLPWSGSSEGAKRGPRLIPAANALHIIKTLAGLQKEFKSALQALKDVYTVRVQQALANQGTLADPTQYPSVDDLDNMFLIRVDIQPVPTVSDFSRLTLPTAVAEALGDRMAKRQSQEVENAMADMTDRIVTTVGNMAKQLHNHAEGGKTRLYASLIDNVKGILVLVRTANLTADPRLTEIAQMMDGLVLHDIKQLKNSPAKAKEVAKIADAVVSRITTPASELPTGGKGAEPQQAPESNEDDYDQYTY